MRRHDVLIAGGGPVGLALALALSDSGLDIALADARSAAALAGDARVLALAHGTRLTLERLGVWPQLPTTPIDTIHVSQQHGFGRTLIRAADHGVPALGYVVTAGALASALRRAVARRGVTLLDHTAVRDSATAAGEVAVVLHATAGTAPPTPCAARLLACAEGALRDDDAAVHGRDYHQHALIACVDAHGGHRNIAFERFTASGPVALLPCGERYAVVHVVPRERAGDLLALDDGAYLARLQACFGTRVRLAAPTARQCHRLGLRYRREPTAPRTVWLGNAAQTLHPVAGQGFNLALRDVWALADTLARHHGDPGSDAVLNAYAHARRVDRRAAIGFTDTLVRLFSNDVAPLHHLRGAGLFLLDVVPPLRGFVARRMMFGARAWP
jgi:2-octaprenyl-6-methoxyphenol hydroxylase